MKLVKQDEIGAWVNCKDELPTVVDSYIVRIMGSSMKRYFNGNRFESEQYNQCTHWLKPINQVYVLTEDEIEELIATYDIKLTQQQWAIGDSVENAKQFIQSIHNDF